MIIRNEDIERVVVEVPEGHVHMRTTITLKDGSEFTLQEAAMSNILRAFVSVKTHPVKNRVTLKAARLYDKKDGFAPWQLIEED